MQLHLHSNGDASSLAALLLPQIFPIFSVVALCQRGASPFSLRRWTCTTDCSTYHLVDQATTGAANAGAATSMAAPRRRGCSSADTVTMSVAAAAGVSARSARAGRRGVAERSHAGVIYPPAQ